MTDLLIPLLLIFVSVYALHKKQDVYAPLVTGAQDGLRLLFSIVYSWLFRPFFGMSYHSAGRKVEKAGI